MVTKPQTMKPLAQSVIVVSLMVDTRSPFLHQSNWVSTSGVFGSAWNQTADLRWAGEPEKPDTPGDTRDVFCPLCQAGHLWCHLLPSASKHIPCMAVACTQIYFSPCTCVLREMGLGTRHLQQRGIYWAWSHSQTCSEGLTEVWERDYPGLCNGTV